MQRRFRFRLDKLLHLREQEVEAARRELARAIARAQAARHGWEALRAHRIHRQQMAAAAERTGLSAEAFAAWRHHLAALLRSEEAAAAELAAAESAVAAARSRVIAKRQAAMVLEQLKERRRQQWREEQDRAEQAELDEMAALRFGRDR